MLNYNFCPKCGGKLGKFFLPEEKTERLKCAKCGFILYVNSKPTVSALIVDGKKVLLGKRVCDPEKGKWDVLGGFLEAGEHPEAGLRREIKEEARLDIKINDFLGFFMDFYGADKNPTLNICYIVEIAKGQPRAGDDIGELKWFDWQKLPKSIAFKNGQEMLEAWKKRLDAADN